MASFLVKLVELVAQCLLISRRIPAHEGKGNNVVDMKGIRDRHEVAALQRHDERLVAAGLIDVVQEAQALQNVESSWRIAHPVRIPAYGSLAGGFYNAFRSVRDEPAFRVRVQRVAVLPGAAVCGGLVPAPDDFACQI